MQLLLHRRSLSSFKTKPIRFISAAVASLLFLLTLIAFLLQLPGESPVKADAIIVLGGGTGDRVSKSLQLYQAGYASRLVLTGNEHSPETSSRTVADARALFLRSRDVPEKIILYVDPSSNSWQEAKSTLVLMQHHAWRNVLVVSDPPHMLRLSYTWRKAFEGYEKKYTLVATEPGWWAPVAWWMNWTSLSFLLSEILKLGYYVVVY